jgi:hypothetical protein
MNNVDNILSALTPFLEMASAVEPSELDLRIDALYKKIKADEICPHMDQVLTLADYKTALQCGQTVTDAIVSHLNLTWNIFTINQAFFLVERIGQVSDNVLGRVTLGSVQKIGETTAFKDSAVWYALAPDEEIQKRQVVDIEKVDFHETDVLTARLQEVEISNQEVFVAPWPFQKQNLTIGALRLLTPKELNGIAKKIPENACALFTDEQVQEVDFSKFSGDQLDKMIEGDKTGRRINRINPDQMREFLKKSSGHGLRQFEVSKIPDLDISKMSADQVAALLASIGTASKEEIAERIQKVPLPQIEHILRLSKDHLFLMCEFLKNLSATQLISVDCSLLTKEQLYEVFPGFSIATLYPGFTHTQSEQRGKVRHFFKKGGVGHGYFQKDLDDEIEKRKAECIASLNKFTVEQKIILMEKVHPEVRKLIQEERRKLFNKKKTLT